MDILNSTLGLLREPWVILVLIASVMFAVGNFTDELLLVKYEQSVGTLVIISGLFGLVLMVIFAVTAFFTGSKLDLPQDTALQAIGVGVLEQLWIIPYLYATKRRGAVVAGPLFQGVPVIAFGLEAMFGIIPPLVQIGGTLLIVFGGILLSIEKEEDEDGKTNHKIDWTTVGLMTISVTLIALIYVLFKDAADDASGYVAVGFWSGLGIFLTGFAIWLVIGSYRKSFNKFVKNADGKAIGIQLFNEVMDAGGAYLTHLANVLGPSVMLVTAFNASQPIAIGLIGALLGLFGVKHAATDGKTSWLLVFGAILFIAVGTVLVALYV